MQSKKSIFNHVIFLGAGASVSSGYPIGNGLRLQISSENHLKAILKKSVQNDDLLSSCLSFYRDSKAIQIFREGCFGTVDEFSKLASRQHQTNVEDMKKLMRLVFSAHNPEQNFHESDYYPFVQRLFDDHNLADLSSEITIMSYNYDCYLDFLLLRAYKQRQKLSGDGNKVTLFHKNQLTSGFFKPEDLGWAEQTLNFNYFKLHGSIFYGALHESKFHDDTQTRLSEFAEQGWLKKMKTPPVVFPWELFERGQFIAEEDFVDTFVKAEKKEAAKLFALYKAIWTGAQEKISRAHKISFVGLSMHEYLKDGLAFLFKKPPTAACVVVANPENEHFRNNESRLHPASLCGKVASTLGQIAPNMKLLRSPSEDDNVFRTDTFEKSYEPDVTPRYSFKEFIDREIK